RAAIGTIGARATGLPGFRRLRTIAGCSTPGPAPTARRWRRTAAGSCASPRSATRSRWRARAPTRRWTGSASRACNIARTSATARSSAPDMDPGAVNDYFVGLQEDIVARLEGVDGNAFKTDEWKRAEGGGGITRVIENGALFERGGVNFSRVKGSQLPASATAARPQLAGQAWEAMGVSLVLHPPNPYCPPVHLTVPFSSAAAPCRLAH